MKDLPGYKKGVNLGGWLSQCNHTKERYDTFIAASDFEKIKSKGYDHVRIPVDYELIMTNEYNFIEENFKYIEFAIDMCKKNGLNMVLDLHRTPGYSFDTFHNEKGLFESESLQNIFYKIWEEFSKRFAKNSNMLAFELLNEVTKKEYMPKWTEMMENSFDIIRKYSSDIKILIGGYYNNSVEAVKDLPMPFDENVVYNFHFYEPLVFTHQGAYWIEAMDTSFRTEFLMTYGEYDKKSHEQLGFGLAGMQHFDSSKTIGADYFETMIKEATDVADERNVALYCGEYGVIDRAAKSEAKKWFDLFESVMDKFKIGRSVWNYREMDFEVD